MTVQTGQGSDWHIWTALVLLAGGVGVFVGGAIESALPEQLPWRHLVTQAGLALVSGLAALLLARLAAISRAAALALVWLALLLVFAGPLPLLAAGFLALSTWSLGQYLFGSAEQVKREAIHLVLGLALLGGSLGWLLAFPIHQTLVYVVGLSALVLLSRRRWRELWLSGPRIKSMLRQPRPIAAFVAIMSLGLASVSLWLPTLLYDDLAYHLGLASQLDRWGYYRMDASSQVWALAPWAGSVLHGVVWLLAGDTARAGLNALWLLLTAALLWRIGGQLRLPESLRWWAVALYASLPLTLMLAAGLHMEGPATAASLGLVSLMLETRERPGKTLLLACATLMGFLVALKASNVLLVGPIGLWLLARWGRTLPWRWVVPCAVLALFLAGSSYLHSWLLTSNPFLPLYNDVFQSPFYHLERFSDQRWQTGFGLELPWLLTFATGRYFEGWSGAAGVVWIALIGLVPMALLDRRARPLLMTGLVALLLPLALIQYVRYAQPALVLLLPVLLVTLRQVPVMAVNLLLGLIVVANLGFHGNSHWTFRDGAVRERVVEGRAALEQRLAPELSIARWVEDQGLDQARILLIDPDRPYHARFAGQGFSRVWYDPKLVGLAWAADQDATGRQWQAFWADQGMTHVVTVGEPSAVWALALESARLVHEVDRAQVWAVGGSPAVDLTGQRDLARTLWPEWLESW
ncbi:MAG: hypothetical protein V2J42_09490 [Wenzhouxiangella sp.]|jgi:hypothetical protein|nr:hypothetical protein [Wenzhouxiangella sp.]